MKSRAEEFSIDMTSIVKGIAIFAMCVHHMFSNNPGIPVAYSLENIKLLLATSGKICVSLFMILSGYGITKSWLKKEHKSFGRFVYNHILKLWFSFVFVYMFCALIKYAQGDSVRAVYGDGWRAIAYFIKDILGLANLGTITPTLVGAWWFMEAIILCYLLFPLLFSVITRGKWNGVICIAICYIPWSLYQVEKGWTWHTDRELFYFYAFAIGIYCARYEIFDRIVKMSYSHKFLWCICSGLGVVFMSYVRSKYCLIVDGVFALTILVFATCALMEIPVISKVLKQLGEKSSDIYMFHVTILGIFARIPFRNDFFKISCFVATCLALAMLLEWVREVLKYNMIVKKLSVDYKRGNKDI